MKTPLLFFAALLISISFLNGQSPMLVEDYNLGPQGSADARIYEFKDALIYEGTSLLGERAILRYDRATDEINVVLTNDDVDGNIDRLIVTSEEIYILTGENNTSTNIYMSEENDLSDLQKIYSSGTKEIWFLRFYKDNILIPEYEIIGSDYVMNFKVLHKDGSISVLYENVNYSPFDFQISAIKDHYLIAHETELLDDNYIVAFNVETRQFAPFTDVVPGYQDCGFISRFSYIPESALYYECDGLTKIYDFMDNKFIDFNQAVFFLNHNTEDHLYLSSFGAYYIIDKNTGQSDIIIDDIVSSRGYFLDHIVFSRAGDKLDVSYVDFENEEIYYFPTEFSSNTSIRLTGFGVVPEAVHTIIYDNDTDNGAIMSINTEAFTIIDSVYNVSFQNRPVAYGEDIYFTHADPSVGSELFWIDYDLSAINEQQFSNAIKILPNPAQHFIRVKYAADVLPKSTSIFDLSGNLMMKNLDHNAIDISILSSGLYVLHTVFANGETSAQKFIKE